jgi:hypothetical protein
MPEQLATEPSLNPMRNAGESGVVESRVRKFAADGAETWHEPVASYSPSFTWDV